MRFFLFLRLGLLNFNFHWTGSLTPPASPQDVKSSRGGAWHFFLAMVEPPSVCTKAGGGFALWWYFFQTVTETVCYYCQKMVNTWIRFWHFSCIIYYYNRCGRATPLLVKDIPENASPHSLVTSGVLVPRRLVAKLECRLFTNRLGDRRHPVGLSGLGWRGVSF